MLKLAGILLVSAAISMAGCYKAGRIKYNMNTRKELYELVLHLKNCIESSSMELSEIFRTCTGENLLKSGFIQKLQNSGESTFSDALKTTELNLPEQLFEIYLKLSKTIGKSRSAKTETETISRFLTEIENAEKKLAQNDESRIVLYKKLGVLTGILAALILI